MSAQRIINNMQFRTKTVHALFTRAISLSKVDYAEMGVACKTIYGGQGMMDVERWVMEAE